MSGKIEKVTAYSIANTFNYLSEKNCSLNPRLSRFKPFFQANFSKSRDWFELNFLIFFMVLDF